MMKKMSVVVTIFNEQESIQELLDALNHQTRLADEVILVDGGSTDHTVDVIKKYLATKRWQNTKLVQFKSNISAGRNYGVKLSANPWIAFTDAGCVPEKNWMEELARPIEKQPRIKVVAGFYRGLPTNSLQEAMIPFSLVMPDQLNVETFLPASRSMLINKSTFLELGGFPEDLEISEDYFFARKLRNQLGKNQLTVAPKAVVGWRPRTNLFAFMKMIFNQAKWDAKAKNWRPKVLFIFGRYLIFVLLLGTVGYLAAILAASYLLWAYFKHARYNSPLARLWTPILQVLSDSAVILGYSLHLLTWRRA
jgi:glycosyltransferase involved in cell wall biosynthesis